eukprot:scaffold9243_cov161-Isochrysis_galbana.AAC.1
MHISPSRSPQVRCSPVISTSYKACCDACCGASGGGGVQTGSAQRPTRSSHGRVVLVLCLEAV